MARLRKNDYQRIATLIRYREQHESAAGRLALWNLALAMADNFETDDIEFKREKFLIQCGFDYSPAR